MKLRKILAMILALLMTGVATAWGNVEMAYDVGTYFMEAESGNYADALAAETMKRVEDANASGGYALYTNAASMDTAPETPSVTWTFTTERIATYTIWMRAYQKDSFWFSVDDNAMEAKWPSGLASATEYTWVKVGSYTLSAGEHTLNFAYRKLGLRLDSIIITKSTSTPSGLTGNLPTDLFAEDYVNEFVLKEGIPTPPAQHPRLLVNGETLPAIKARLTSEENAGIYQAVVDNCAAVQSCTLPALTSGQVNNGNGSLMAYIEDNAFLYLIGNGDVYGQRAITGILEYLNSYAIADPSNTNNRHAIGRMLMVAAEVYDWCYPLLTETQMQTIIKMGIANAYHMEIGYPPINEKAYISGHSMEAQLLRDLLAFSVAIYDEYQDTYNIVSDRLFNEYIPTLNYFYESSFHNQGVFYGSYRHEFELYCKWILEAMGHGDYISDAQKEIVYNYIYTRRPDGNFLKDGDDSVGVVSEYYNLTMLSLLAGNLYGDPYIRQEYYRSRRLGYIDRLGGTSNSRVHFLLLNDPSIGLASFDDLPLSKWFGTHSGVMVARTGWEEGANADTVVVSMKTPERFFKGHGHLDAGEFEIYYKEPLAMDTGTYNEVGFGSAHDFGYHKLTVAHNCLLIEGLEGEKSLWSSSYSNAGGQQPPTYIGNHNTLEEIKGWATDFGDVLGYDYGEDMRAPSYTYLKGDLTKAYNGDPTSTDDDKAELYTRTFMFENLFGEDFPAALIVFDKIKSNETQMNYTKKWVIHSQDYPWSFSVGGKGLRIRYGSSGTGVLYNHILMPEEYNIARYGSSSSGYFIADGINYSTSVTNESGKYRAEVYYDTPQETEYFLNVIEIGQYTPQVSSIPCTKFETDSYVGVQLKDRVVWLSKNEARTTDSVTVEGAADAYETLIYKVDGLKEGTWKVTAQNGTSFLKNVADNGGVLCFEAAPGTYTLTYENATYTTKNFSIYANRLNSGKETVYTSLNGYMNSEMTVEEINGVAYAPVDELAALLGATVETTAEGVKLTNGDYYLIFNEGEHLVEKDGVWRDGTYYTLTPPYTKDGKLYVSVTDCQNVLQTYSVYTDYANVLSMQTNYSYNPSDTLQCQLTVTYNQEGGTVMLADGSAANGCVVPAESQTSLTVTPAEGYYAASITWNGTETVSDNLIGTTYTTPTARANSVLQVIFLPVDGVEQVMLYENVFGGDSSTLTFGKTVNLTKATLVERGILCSAVNPMPTTADVDDINVLKLAHQEPTLLFRNDFGIRLTNAAQLFQDGYYIRAYAIYQQASDPDEPTQTVIYSENSVPVGK